MLWARCYLNDQYSHIKEFKNNKHVKIIKNNKIKTIQKKFFKIIKRNIQNSNLYPINFLINSNTSAHYAGDFEHIKKNILKQSEGHFNKKLFLMIVYCGKNCHLSLLHSQLWQRSKKY